MSIAHHVGVGRCHLFQSRQRFLGSALLHHTQDSVQDDDGHDSSSIDELGDVAADGVFSPTDESRDEGCDEQNDDEELIEDLKARDVPVVLISAGPRTRNLAPSVGIDDRQAGLELGTYLYSLGHRRFGFIGGPKEHRSAALRLEGLREALNGSHESEASISVVEGNFTFKSGIDLAAMIGVERSKGRREIDKG